jgi:hypothetical protein
LYRDSDYAKRFFHIIVYGCSADGGASGSVAALLRWTSGIRQYGNACAVLLQ